MCARTPGGGRAADPYHTSRKGRQKQKVPWAKRVARRRRRAELAKQHRKIIRDIERRKREAAERAAGANR